MIQKTILFVPSNRNHVIIFNSLTDFMRGNKFIFITQGSYKNEGAENELIKVGKEFKKIESYKKKDPTYILKKENVGVVVIGNDIDVIPQWFIHCAKNLKIPTVLIQDGLLFKLKTKHDFRRSVSQIKLSKSKLLLLESKLLLTGNYKKITYGESKCEQIHVWGKPFQKYLEKKGINKKQILNIGYLKNKKFNVNKEKTDECEIILYTPTELVKPGIISFEEMKKNTDILFSTIISFNDIKLIIKPHPIEKTIIYDEFAKKYPDKITVSKSDFFTTLKECSLLITNLSTTAIEALAMNKPVIVFLPKLKEIVDSDQCHRDLIAKNVILYADNRKSLEKQIKKIIDKKISLNDKDLANVLNDYLGSRDNEPLRKSSQAIISLLRN